MAGISRADVSRNGGPNTRQVVASLNAITAVTDEQSRQLVETFAAHDIGWWSVGANAGWRSAVACGHRRGRAWYLARHAAEDVAFRRGLGEVDYWIGYAADAVCRRDKLTGDEFTALTQPWVQAVGAL